MQKNRAHSLASGSSFVIFATQKCVMTATGEGCGQASVRVRQRWQGLVIFREEQPLMTVNSMKTFCMIGAGNVAWHLAAALEQTGLTLLGVYSRGMDHALYIRTLPVVLLTVHWLWASVSDLATCLKPPSSVKLHLTLLVNAVL